MNQATISQAIISQQRLANQCIASALFARPAAVVQWLGAMQAQDYGGALWAVGLRTPTASEQAVGQALAERAIVRTWPMRGTLHVVAAADVRWMLELLAPRAVQRSQGRLKQLGLDAPTIAASAQVITRALEGGKQLQRAALCELLEAANIVTSGQRGYHILGQLAHQRLICFGAHAGKQPTFALLDEWVPPARSLPRDEALATLAARYFTSHGPATIHDFIWWSGLAAADARAGLAAAQLAHAECDGQHYYFAHEQTDSAACAHDAFLLPPFDEFLVGYRDRSASLDPRYNTLVVPGGNGIFNPIVVIDGRVVGTWKRAFKGNDVLLTFGAFSSWSAAQAEALAAVAEQYGRFVGKRAVVAGLP